MLASFGGVISRLGRDRLFLLLAPVVLFLLVFFLFPFVTLFRISFAVNEGGSGFGEGTLFYEAGTWTLANYIQFFTDRFFTDMALFTIQFGIMVGVIATFVSYLLAYQIYRSGPLMKSVLLLAVILPKFTNIIVLMYGLLVVFGRSGLVNDFLLWTGIINEPLQMLFNLFGVLLGETIIVMPYCVLVIVAVLHSIDDALLEAAEGLGASRARAFFEVTLPLSLPAVWVSLLLAFMWGVGAFASPYLLGNADLYTLSVEVDRQVNWRLNWAMGSTIAYVLMAMIIVLMYVYSRLQRESGARS